ncbi:MAG: T9SS type A sorting domain-containing protein, partial [Candidatus Delongbacteria bacterium]|nr:T9SS type A sorting domain-containing protein [Candidatus Delongbacteria bacterium]
SYLKQTQTGSAAGTPDGPIVWSFDWTAPANSSSDVIFYAAGNAANNNSSTAGDYIYTAAVTIPVVETVAADGQVVAGISLQQNYPNPFNPTTTIRFNLTTPQTATIVIHNTLGQEVHRIVMGQVGTGLHELNFDAGSLPSGVYFYTLRTGSLIETRKMVLLQ